MIKDLLNNPDLKKYLHSFDDGHRLFLEGDTSQDLFILASGRLDILKGGKKIAEIANPGSFFGEMSFLLGDKRTSTVRASGNVTAFCIPYRETESFLERFPEVARRITLSLAKRLEETSQVLYGLKEISDQLPDAVIGIDPQGKILNWNYAAEELYGRHWDRTPPGPAEELFADSQEYNDFFQEAISGRRVREKIIRIHNPEKGDLFVSTSTTILFDGHHNFKGVLCLGRDVTAIKVLERRYRRMANFLIPFLAVLFIAAASLFYAYPYFSPGQEKTTLQGTGLRNRLANDFLILKSLLLSPLDEKNTLKAASLIKDFFALQEKETLPYTGLVLLDKTKKVLSACRAEQDGKNPDMIGNSYTGIAFKGNEKSLHKVLTLYRSDSRLPMGQKGIEIAFELHSDAGLLGWILFQLDIEELERTYGLDEDDLIDFEFQR